MKNFIYYVTFNLLIAALLWIGAFHHVGGWRLAWVLQVVGLAFGTMVFLGISLMDEEVKRAWVAKMPAKVWQCPAWFNIPLDIAFAMWCAWFGRPFLCASILISCGLSHAIRVLIRTMREEMAQQDDKSVVSPQVPGL